MNPTPALSPKSLPQSLPPVGGGRESAASLADARRQGGFATLLDRAGATQPGLHQPPPSGVLGANVARPPVVPGSTPGSPPKLETKPEPAQIPPPHQEPDADRAAAASRQRDAATARSAAAAHPAAAKKAEEATRPTTQEQRLDGSDPEHMPVSFPASNEAGDGDGDSEAPIDELQGTPLPWWSTLQPVVDAVSEKRTDAPAGPALSGGAAAGPTTDTDRVTAAGAAAAATAAATAERIERAVDKNPNTAQPVPSGPDAAPAIGAQASAVHPEGPATGAASLPSADPGVVAATAAGSGSAAATAVGLIARDNGAAVADATRNREGADPVTAGLLPSSAGPLGALAAATTAAIAGLPTRLLASPGSPDFAAQLGASIATFVRQGLQQARLELNPAEMGPLSVQIQLDGTRAQVHLL
ncbi:MAG: flagellar hook-length control protein FliK, partial [Rubrivivax sp.]